MSNYAGLGGSSGGGGGGDEVQFIKQRVQLADLPAALSTGIVLFGAVIPANSIVLGGLLYMNSDVNVGGSGITVVNVSLGALGIGNLFTTVDLVGVVGSPQYRNEFTDPGSWTIGPLASAVAGQPGYQITAVGANLDQLVAFDITIIVALLTGTVVVP